MEAPQIVDYLDEESKAHLMSLLEYMDEFDLPYALNPRIVRGLDYYTKTVFEIKSSSLGAQNTLCGGGRYDALFKLMGGGDTPAVGFSIGLERLVLVLTELKFFENKELNKRDLFVAALGAETKEKILPYIFSLKEKGICVDYDFSKDNLKKLLKVSDKIGSKYTLLLGQEELENKKVILRNMKSKKQHELLWDELIKNIETIVKNGD